MPQAQAAEQDLAGPDQWMSLAAGVGRATAYGLLTPWSESLGDYLPASKATPERVEYARKAAIASVHRTMDELIERNIRREIARLRVG